MLEMMRDFFGFGGSNPVAPILAKGQNRAGEFGAGDQEGGRGEPAVPCSPALVVRANLRSPVHLLTCSTVLLSPSMWCPINVVAFYGVDL
jgi:hypothetical protein